MLVSVPIGAGQVLGACSAQQSIDSRDIALTGDDLPPGSMLVPGPAASLG